jgi:uncharacterized membrane protein YgcG
MRTGVWRAVGTVVGLLVVATAGAGCTSDSKESISSYDVRIAVGADAAVAVTETIVYDFGPNAKHGIFRTITLRTRHGWRSDRWIRVDGATATMDGNPVPVSSRTEGGSAIITAGDPARTVSGRHTYVLRYTARDTIERTADGPRLSWTAVGDQWDVPIAAVTVTVTGPAAAGRVECAVGSPGDWKGCAEARTAGDTASFRGDRLPKGTAMTVAVGYPRGSVAAADPVLADQAWLRWMHSIPGRFRPAAGVLAGTLAAAAVIVVAGCWPYWRRLHYGGQPHRGWRRFARGRPPRLPDRLPPAVFSAADWNWTNAALGATVVDLAVRGHVRVEEAVAAADEAPATWELVRVAGDGAALMPCEKVALEVLFGDDGRVRVGQPNTLHDTWSGIRHQLRADCNDRGWYRYPTIDIAWVGPTVTLLSALAVLALAIWTHAALLAVGPLAAGVIVWVTASDRRSAGGLHEAVLQRRAEIAEALAATTLDAIPAAARAERFSRDLPYAIEARRADEWIDLFAGVLDAPGQELPWYRRGTMPGVGLATAVRRFVAATLVSSGPRPSKRRASYGNRSYAAGGYYSGSSDSSSSSSSSSYGGSSSSGGGGGSW